ncbi:MAG: hypothetical protein J6V48_08765 [Clostridia bacterium]|nr:hypothetical protein [Clostridia bacterium]
MRKLKITALLLSALFIIGALAGCADRKGGEDTTAPAGTADTTQAAETTESLYDGEGYLKDSLPEGLNFDTTITTLMWSDYTMTEFYVDDINGNIIDSAIYRRNSSLEERLGVTLAWDSSPGNDKNISQYTTKVRADYNSDRNYDIYATYSRTPPALSLEGYTIDLLSTKYFDVEKPWWPSALTDECEIGGKLYYASGDISTNLLWMMIGTFYNKALYKSYESDPLFQKTPEELVASGEWTIERLMNMTKDIYVDTDGSNSRSEGDTYGFVIYETNVDAFQTAAGVTSIIKTADGGIEVNPKWNGQYTADVCQMVGDWLSTQGCIHTSSTGIRNVFFDERGVFITDRCFIVAGKDNASSKTKIEFSYGIVPQPKAYADQENYCTNVGHPFTMYAISSGSDKAEAASAVLEAMGSGGYRYVTPQVFETTMKIRYADGAEAAEMYDILRGTVSFDLGRLFAESFGNTTANAFRKAALGTPSTYLTTLSTARNAFKNGIEKITGAAG